jgi:hypothetical protein
VNSRVALLAALEGCIGGYHSSDRDHPGVLRLNNVNSTDSIRWLLDRGVDFIVDPGLQLSAFHSAIIGGFHFGMDKERKQHARLLPCNLDSLAFLLEHFHDHEHLDFKGLNGETTLHLAVARLDINAAKMLKKLWQA